MAKITTLIATLLQLSALAVLAAAAPPSQQPPSMTNEAFSISDIGDIVGNSIGDSIGNIVDIFSRGNKDDPKKCIIHGEPVSKQHPSAYPIDDYTLVTVADLTAASYGVNKEWDSVHRIGDSHYIAATQATDQFAAFKCQYLCNNEDNNDHDQNHGKGGCVSYFVSYMSPGTNDEHAECVLYDDIIDATLFVPVTDTIAGGGYNKICPK